MLSGATLAQEGAKPTDPQIAHIAYTGGEIDIKAAKQALAKSRNKEVRAFAQQMVRDHTAVNKQALAPGQPARAGKPWETIKHWNQKPAAIMLASGGRSAAAPGKGPFGQR
jgi:hypothetical protein